MGARLSPLTSNPNYTSAFPNRINGAIPSPNDGYPYFADSATGDESFRVQGCAFDPVHERLYCAVENIYPVGNVSWVEVVDTAAKADVAVISVPINWDSPLFGGGILTQRNLTTGIAVNPNRNLVYVASADPNDPTGSLKGILSVIDGVTDTVVATISIPGQPACVTVAPNGMIYVSCWPVDPTLTPTPWPGLNLPGLQQPSIAAQNGVLVTIDGDTNQVVSTVPVGVDPRGVAIGNGYAYVCDPWENKLSVIDLTQTSTGTGVSVAPSPTTSLTFGNVVSPGSTTVAPLTSPPPALPANFQVASTSGSFPTYFDIQTTATFSGSVDVCVAYDPLQFPWDPGTNPTGAKPALLHYVNGAWQDVTSSIDVPTHRVCGTTTSFSPFAVTKQTAVTWSGTLSPVYMNGSSTFHGSGTVPVKFNLTGAWAGFSTLQARLYYSQTDNFDPGPTNEATSNGQADSGNLFRYSGSQYMFNWSVKGIPRGTYWIDIYFDDTDHYVKVSLTH
ncbi:MAG: PxKF domain-containing protein [Fimbriimonadales bacterium]